MPLTSPILPPRFRSTTKAQVLLPFPSFPVGFLCWRTLLMECLWFARGVTLSNIGRGSRSKSRKWAEKGGGLQDRSFRQLECSRTLTMSSFNLCPRGGWRACVLCLERFRIGTTARNDDSFSFFFAKPTRACPFCSRFLDD